MSICILLMIKKHRNFKKLDYWKLSYWAESMSICDRRKGWQTDGQPDTWTKQERISIFAEFVFLKVYMFCIQRSAFNWFYIYRGGVISFIWIILDCPLLLLSAIFCIFRTFSAALFPFSITVYLFQVLLLSLFHILIVLKCCVAGV